MGFFKFVYEYVNQVGTAFTFLNWKKIILLPFLSVSDVWLALKTVKSIFLTCENIKYALQESFTLLLLDINSYFND